MKAYRVETLNQEGKRSRETIRAQDGHQAAGIAERSGNTVIAVQETPASETGRSLANPKSILAFTEGLDVMVNAGLSLRDATSLSAQAHGDRRGGKLAAFISERLDAGDSFSDVVVSLGSAFPPVYAGLIRIGETTGSLSSSLSLLSGYMRERKALRDKILGSLSYPLLVLTAAIVGSVVLAIIALPRVQELASGMAGSAESLQGAASTMSFMLRAMGTVIALVAVSVPALLLGRRLSASFARTTDHALLRLPAIRHALLVSETLSFAFAMEALTSAGVGVEAALPEAAEVLGNRALRDSVMQIHSSVVHGTSISDAFREHSLFPAAIAAWLAIGERIGNVGSVFGQIRQSYRAELDRLTTGFMNLVEPVMILVVGLILLSLVLVFVLPLFTVYESFL